MLWKSNPMRTTALCVENGEERVASVHCVGRLLDDTERWERLSRAIDAVLCGDTA